MIAFILFQINILSLTLFSISQCAGRKKNSDSGGAGDGDVSLVQPGILNATPNAVATSSSASKPMNDDFSVGVPPPHIPLADKSDERTLADIESIQSEKTMIKKNKAAKQLAFSKSPSLIKSPAAAPATGSTSAENGGAKKGSRSPARV